MKDIILIIDDNSDLIFNLKILFELNEFEVYTASNGIEGRKRLYEDKITPSIIVCDIMMPKMNGYDFFKLVSSDPNLNSIPFIFLTAKSSSEDVRFGKLLGIDDYLTKPFLEDDLLAIVKGKIRKRNKIRELNKNFAHKEINHISKLQIINEIHSFENAELFLIIWDEMEGPKLIDYCPQIDSVNPKELGQIGVQLFQSSVSIFGFQDEVSKQSLLLSIKNIGKKGFLLFDSYNDQEVRGNQRLFMIGLINKEISYYDSLILEKHLGEASEGFKNTKEIHLKGLYQEIFKNGMLS